MLENLGAGAFDLQKLIFYSYRFSLRDTGAVHSIALSDAGEGLALESLIGREQELYVDRYGRVDKRLVDSIANTDPGARVDVVLWAKQSRDVSLSRPDSQASLDDKQINSLYAQLDAERASIAKESTERLVSRLEAEGLRAGADALPPTPRLRTSPVRVVQMRISTCRSSVRAAMSSQARTVGTTPAQSSISSRRRRARIGFA